MHAVLTLFVLGSIAMTAGAQAPSPGDGTALTAQRMLSLTPLPRAQFVREWDGLRDAELARVPRTGAADARIRLAFRHAQGRVMYPFFHWRETDAGAIEPDPGLAEVLAQLPAIDARLWQFREVRDFLDARLHELARQRLASDPELGRGDARWLRAGLLLSMHLLSRATCRFSRQPSCWRNISTMTGTTIDQPVRGWLARSPPAENVRKINDAIAADRAHLRGVRSLRYREVSGTPLFLHILEPAKARAAPRAAMLWLHGGSATEGTWWHSPITTRALLDAGVVVVAVDLTTGNRFDRDADQITDASEAFDYVTSHAAELGIDPRESAPPDFPRVPRSRCYWRRAAQLQLRCAADFRHAFPGRPPPSSAEHAPTR